jgi:DNA replication protein DnaC
MSDDRFDLTTREGVMRRADEITRRRIPPRYRDATATEPGVTAWCDHLTDAYATGEREAVTSLLITGPTGSGKTWQAYGAIRRIMASVLALGWDAATAPDLFAKLRPGGSLDTEAEYQRWANLPLVFLDDLGAAKDSEWTEEITYRLVNHRSACLLPSIFTTNLPVRAADGQPSLRSAVSERVFSRLAECTVVPLKGRDRRLRSAS